MQLQHIKYATIAPFLYIIVLTLGIVFVQNRYIERYIENSDTTIDHNSAHQRLRNSLALQKRLPTLGFHNLLANWNYLQFIQYLGDTEARKQTGHSAITDFFELVAQKDPRFLQANLMLSVSNSIYAGRADESVEILNRIIPYNSPQQNPDSFFLWTYKGTDEILFTADIPSAINSYQNAAQWSFARGDELGNIVASRNLQTVEFLKNNPDSRKAQVGAWGSILFAAIDKETQQLAIDRIKSLGGDVIFTDDGRIIVQPPQQD